MMLTVGAADDAFASSVAVPPFAAGNVYMLNAEVAGESVLIDGRPTDPSATTFRAAARAGAGETRWLEGEEDPPAHALGHLINHSDTPCVEFKAAVLDDVPDELQKVLPTLRAPALAARVPPVAVAVVTTREVEPEEELFANYGRDPTSLGVLS